MDRSTHLDELLDLATLASTIDLSDFVEGRDTGHFLHMTTGILDQAVNICAALHSPAPGHEDAAEGPDFPSAVDAIMDQDPEELRIGYLCLLARVELSNTLEFLKNQSPDREGLFLVSSCSRALLAFTKLATALEQAVSSREQRLPRLQFVPKKEVQAELTELVDRLRQVVDPAVKIDPDNWRSQLEAAGQAIDAIVGHPGHQLQPMEHQFRLRRDQLRVIVALRRDSSGDVEMHRALWRELGKLVDTLSRSRKK